MVLSKSIYSFCADMLNFLHKIHQAHGDKFSNTEIRAFHTLMDNGSKIFELSESCESEYKPPTIFDGIICKDPVYLEKLNLPATKLAGIF
jgi:hypothetical protein